MFVSISLAKKTINFKKGAVTMDVNSDLYDKLTNQKEAFIMAIELYNKHPQLNIVWKDLDLFICNAWELMLKTYI